MRARVRNRTPSMHTYDKGFGYKANPQNRVGKIIEYCDNLTTPQAHWERLPPDEQAMFTVESEPAPKVPAHTPIAPRGKGVGRGAGKGNRKKKPRGRPPASKKR